MNSMLPQYKKILVDGQSVIVPSMMDLKKMIAKPEYLDLLVYSSGMQALVTSLIHFIFEHEQEFALGLCRVNFSQKSWLPIVLFNLNGIWQRVHIEYPKCEKCDWRGAIANPTEPSLYFGVPFELSTIRHAHKLPCLGCPCCGSVLARHAVWTDKCNDER